MKRLAAGTVVICALVLSSGTAGAVSIFMGNSYEVVAASGISWINADLQAYHRGDGWHLATITSAEEQVFIAGLLGTPDPSEPIVEYWLGGLQPPGSTEPSGGWYWVTGEEFSYTNWGGDEPNNSGDEGYLAMDDRYNWGWNDNTSSLYAISGYVLERDGTPVPEPGTMILLGSGLIGLAGYGRKRHNA